MKKKMKLTIDVVAQRGDIRGLTDDEGRAMEVDIAERMASLRQQWERTGDLRALVGALIFCQAQLPEWLFKGLMQNFEQQRKNPDAIRFLAVRHAHDVLGKTTVPYRARLVR
jgi:hypothetical protein